MPSDITKPLSPFGCRCILLWFHQYPPFSWYLQISPFHRHNVRVGPSPWLMGLSWASWVSPPISYYAPPYNTAPPSTSASLSTTPLSLDGTASNSSSSYNNLPMTPMLVISYCMWYPVLLSLVVSLAQHSPPDTLSHPCSLQMGRFIPYDFLPCFPKGLAMGHVYSHLHDVFAMLLPAPARPYPDSTFLRWPPTLSLPIYPVLSPCSPLFFPCS